MRIRVSLDSEHAALFKSRVNLMRAPLRNAIFLLKFA
jgi:hypothetical protein